MRRESRCGGPLAICGNQEWERLWAVVPPAGARHRGRRWEHEHGDFWVASVFASRLWVECMRHPEQRAGECVTSGFTTARKSGISPEKHKGP